MQWYMSGFCLHTVYLAEKPDRYTVAYAASTIGSFWCADSYYFWVSAKRIVKSVESGYSLSWVQIDK